MIEGADSVTVIFHRAVHGGTDTVVIDGNNFARKDVPDEFCINGIESRCFRSQHPALFRPAQYERAVAERIAAAVECIIRACYDGICAMDFIHQFNELFFFCFSSASCQKLDNDFGIHGSLERGAFQKQSSAKVLRVDQVAVMCQRHRSVYAVSLQRLYVGWNRRACGGITYVSNTDMPVLFR